MGRYIIHNSETRAEGAAEGEVQNLNAKIEIHEYFIGSGRRGRLPLSRQRLTRRWCTYRWIRYRSARVYIAAVVLSF